MHRAEKGLIMQMKNVMRSLAGMMLVLVLGAVIVSAAPNGAPVSEFGTGWTAQYFNNRDLSGAPVLTAAAPLGVNFNFGTGSPDPVVNVDDFSARYQSVQFFTGGLYEFVVASDDGVRVLLDGVTVLDRFVPRVFTTDRFQLTITPGTHALTVEYFEAVDQAIVQFQYFLIPSGTATAITNPGGIIGTPFGTPPGPTPTITAIPPTALPVIPPGALTGTVIRAQVLLVRNAPFFAGGVVGRIRRGQTYQVIGRDGDARWFLVQLSGFQGWVWGYYLFVNGNEFNAPVQNTFVTAGDPGMTGVAVQTNATMRLRAEPNTVSAQIGRIPWGDILPVVGRSGDGVWYQVVFRGTTGWIASEFTTQIAGDVNVVPVR